MVLRTAKREGMQKGWLKGKSEGIIEGKLEGIFLVASNLIKQGLSLDTIKAATNLSDQELEKL